MSAVVAKRKYKYIYVNQRDWKVHTNRVANIVERAIRISDQYLQTHSPAIQYVCQEQIRKTTFSWFDTYPGGGQAIEAEPEHFTPVSVNVLERKHTNYLGNKWQLAQTLIEKNIQRHVPVTHFSGAQAMAFSQNDRVLFVKSSTGTRGEGVSCIRSTQLPEFELPKNFILQENIANLALRDERKMVFRFYVLIYNQCVYIHRKGVAIVHGPKYDADSTDHRVQIQHNGPGVVKDSYPFSKVSDNDYWFDKIVEAATALAPIFERARQESSLFRFILLGADGLPCTDDCVRVLEFNTFPNMVNNEQEDPVYAPVLSSVLLLTVAGLNDNAWVRIA